LLDRGEAVIEKKYSVADFFAGCGGLSYGFGLTGRFNVVLGSDIKPEALDTFVRNHISDAGKPEVILEDIRKIPPKSVSAKLSRILRASGSLDCLIGGPPCEGFSQNRSINSGGNVVDGM
jgi:DNA (cytosine-5)-methyltransferase 1